jgi:diadenosine tetraphosphate (Ap4A) HIT family hydrolase
MKSVFETEFSYVIPNKIEYDLWESHRVLEHHMVLPKRHAESISEMNDQERQDMLQIIADYEAKGFNIYARGVGGPTRSIAHQHTHLIRIQPDRPKLIVHIKKPHFLIRL